MLPAIPVILNARAGTGVTVASTGKLPALFRTAGLDGQWLVAGDAPGIVNLTRRALRDQPRMIVAGGGDGTISAVASVLVGTEVALGILPMGTLNHFARDLRIPDDLEGAVRVLATGVAAAIDVGEVNGRIFLNNSSLGLYPTLVHHRQQQQERLGRGKWTAFFRSALLVLRRYPLLSVSVRLDGIDLIRRTPLVFVGNNVYQMEGLNIGMRERLDGGTLSLYIPRRAGRLGLIRIAIRALFGRLRAVDDFDSLRATELLIETRRKRVRVATDGEVTRMATPLHYKVRPGALRVIVPEATCAL
jgi:diacylglycerol kinase family enzyme